MHFGEFPQFNNTPKAQHVTSSQRNCSCRSPTCFRPRKCKLQWPIPAAPCEWTGERKRVPQRTVAPRIVRTLLRIYRRLSLLSDVFVCARERKFRY